MKCLASAVVVLIVSTSFLNAGPTVYEARQRLLRGNYAEAREIYAELAKTAKNRVTAAIGISRCLESEGSYDEALKTIDKALKQAADQPDLLARRAELLYLRGRWDDAEKSATKAIDKMDDNFLARWVLGQILRDRGELDKADEAFRWFVRTYSDRSDKDMEITDPELLQLVGLAGCERARTHALKDQFQFILDDVWGEAAKKDKDFWWAEYESGRLFLEKYNKAAAERAFDKALVINPQAAQVLACKGLSAMQRLDIKDAENYADKALEINPKLTVALCLKADIYQFGNQIDLAIKELDKARAVNPREEPILARVAACLLAQKKKAEFDTLVQAVDQQNPHAAVFYCELAEILESRKSFDEAAKYFARSLEAQPKYAAAQSGLGMLYMRLGKEKEARKLLIDSFDADSFNIRVSNTLKVLDHLDKYDTHKTEHFIIRFDAKHDKILANFLAEYLENFYEEFSTKFQYRPKGPFLIEVFNRHEMFSGRVIALPDLHTIGACTGSMFAMVSLRDKSKFIGRPFNWVRVTRHELVHIFNLDQTRFQVPHWLTEGLAVSLEGSGTPPGWNKLLVDKTRAGELLNLDNILLGFVRPRSPDEWQLAYLQSLLYVQFVTKQYGEKAIGELLAAYAEGLDTPAVLEKVCKVGKADFEKGYQAFLQERVKQIGLQGGRKAMTFKQLKEAHAKDMTDADVAAQLADRYYQIGNKKEARKLADKVLTDKTTHPLAAYVKAMLLSDAGDADLALSLLEGNVDDKTTEPKAIRLLARLQVQSKKTDEAAKTLELGRKLDPNEPAWLLGLAKLYKQSGEMDKLNDILRALVRLDPDDLASRRKLAEVSLKEGNFADAESFARQALEIDVLDAEAQDVLLEALAKQNKDDEARHMKKLLER